MEKKIEEMAKIMSDNFNGYDGKKYEPYDFEWCAYMLQEKGYRKQQEVAQDIISLANEVKEFFENDATVDDEHKVYFKLAMRFFQTKIMERYGV